MGIDFAAGIRSLAHCAYPSVAGSTGRAPVSSSETRVPMTSAERDTSSSVVGYIVSTLVHGRVGYLKAPELVP